MAITIGLIGPTKQAERINQGARITMLPSMSISTGFEHVENPIYVINESAFVGN